MLRGSQVKTEPSCDILGSSLSSSLVHVTRIPGEHRAILWHSWFLALYSSVVRVMVSLVNIEPSCAILCPSSLLLPGPCYGGPRWIQSYLVTFFVLALYSSLVNIMEVPGEYRAILCHSLSSLSTTPPWSMLRGSQVNTEPSCDILGPRSLLVAGICYGVPRWIQSHLGTFFVLALFYSLVHVMGVPGEYRVVEWHYLSWISSLPGPCKGAPGENRTLSELFIVSWSPLSYPGCLSMMSISPPRWSVLQGSQMKTELSHYQLICLDHPFHILAVFLCPCSHLLPGLCQKGSQVKKSTEHFQNYWVCLGHFCNLFASFLCHSFYSSLVWDTMVSG